MGAQTKPVSAKAAQHTPGPLPWDTAEYWEGLARSERAFAQDKRTARYGTVESIRIHEQNAKEYEYRAAQIRSPKGGA